MKRRVLVVDDEKGIREALRQLLEFEQIEVQTCASGSEAFRRCFCEQEPNGGIRHQFAC